MFNFTVKSALLLFLVGSFGDLNAALVEEYELMPPLFHLDDWEKCLMLNEKALYCQVTVQMSPIDLNNSSKEWKVIQNAIKDVQNYRHDRLRYGICVPTWCPNYAKNNYSFKMDEEFLQKEISQCFSIKFQDMALKGNVTEMHCETQENFYKIDKYDLIIGVTLVSYTLLIIFGTYYEGTARYKTKEEYKKITGTTFGKILTCFSLPKNWSKLRTPSKIPDAIALQPIQGIRFFTMILVIMTHTCMVSLASPIINPQYIETITENIQHMFLLNGHCAIQIFFMISGFLLSFHFCQLMEKKKDFKLSSLILAFVHRYIRLTPALLVVMAVSGTWLYHLGRGPIWDDIVGYEYRNCRKNGWTNLLYINNIYIDREKCLLQTWYIAADTQLYMLSLIVIGFMWKFKNYTKLILGVFTTIAFLIPAVLSYIFDFDMIIRITPESSRIFLIDIDQSPILYFSGYANWGGYMVGMVFGYIYFSCKEKKLFSKKIHEVYWWIFTWIPPLLIIFLGGIAYQSGYEKSRIGSAIYATASKNVYALSLAFGLLGLICGTGWFVRPLLMWQPLNALGRLSYGAYLVHLPIERIRGGNRRSPVYLSDYTILYEMLCDVVFTYICATILYLCVELPISALQTLILPQLSDKRQDKAPPTTAEQPREAINGTDGISIISRL